MTAEARRVLIVDDHEVTRRGLREIVLEALPGSDVREAIDVAELEARLAESWDLILLDLGLPGAKGLEPVETACARAEDAAVLIVTGRTEIEFVLETLKAGAAGFIQKRRAADDLLEAIERVATGGTYLHPDTAARVAAALREQPAQLPHEKLSSRELEIFERIAQGLTIKEIAADLGLSDKTVATYLGRIREKTGLVSHVDIARYAMRHGIVD